MCLICVECGRKIDFNGQSASIEKENGGEIKINAQNRDEIVNDLSCPKGGDCVLRRIRFSSSQTEVQPSLK